jgi:translation initiation factor IF-1
MGAQLEGVVEEEVPRGLYKVKSEDGRTFLASLPAASRHGMVKLLPGDRVILEVSPTDDTRARIKKRLR